MSLPTYMNVTQIEQHMLLAEGDASISAFDDSLKEWSNVRSLALGETWERELGIVIPGHVGKYLGQCKENNGQELYNSGYYTEHILLQTVSQT